MLLYDWHASGAQKAKRRPASGRLLPAEILASELTSRTSSVCRSWHRGVSCPVAGSDDPIRPLLMLPTGCTNGSPPYKGKMSWAIREHALLLGAARKDAVLRKNPRQKPDTPEPKS